MGGLTCHVTLHQRFKEVALSSLALPTIVKGVVESRKRRLQHPGISRLQARNPGHYGRQSQRAERHGSPT